MGSARRLLLVAALAFAIAADTLTDATLSTLTLSPDTDSLITTRDDSTTASTSSSTTAIGSAASDTHKVTKAPETETPATTAPQTWAPITSSESDATSASDSGEQDTTDTPSSASATVSPGSTSDRSTHDSESQTDSTKSTSPSKSTASKSSTASVDTLNSSGDGLSSGSSFSMGTTLPVVFGALACVGAIVMAVTYKKKRGSNAADSEGNRPSSDCEYTSGADFTPDNRALSIVHEDSASLAVKVSGSGPQSSADMRTSAAIADFTGTGSSVCSSPFGSTRGKVRVSSPVQSGYSSSEANMEFQDTGLRHDGGSNVVLTFEEIPTDSSHAAPQVQL
ncbi:hypothetical protein V7S43_005372 [Phytophthora oleae]|uniref:Uncharacterized protein n=1 Tax=Phytophthora oleae TaxID=2107226 RepID=A0ABD3FWF6_9STRA